VTRTVHRFVGDAKGSQFKADRRPRHAVVLDLYGGVASYDPAEVLAIVRNGLVDLLNDIKGVKSSIGTYLLPFDVLYALWIRHARLDKRDVTALVPTARGKAAGAVLKLGLKITGVEFVEVLGELPGVAAALGSGGHVGKIAADLGREDIVEKLGEHMDAGLFVKKYIAPSVNARLRAALKENLSDVRFYSFVLQRLLLEAIDKVQRDLAEQGKVILAVDAIDEAAGPEKSTIRLRSNICSLFSDPEAKLEWVGGVLCGRGPIDLWKREVNLRKPTMEHLGEMEDEDLIRTAFHNAGLVDPELDKLVSGLARPIYAGELSESCEGLKWPRRRA